MGRADESICHVPGETRDGIDWFQFPLIPKPLVEHGAVGGGAITD